ncbi:MAG: hypothetical protein AB8F74_05620 [Saprospiraceae bacterium]
MKKKHAILNSKLIGKTLLMFGILGFLLKLTEPYIITKGCFGYNYFYEIFSFAIPVTMIVVGYKKLFPEKKKKKKKKK